MTTITPQDLTTFQFERWPFMAPIIIEPGRNNVLAARIEGPTTKSLNRGSLQGWDIRASQLW